MLQHLSNASLNFWGLSGILIPIKIGDLYVTSVLVGVTSAGAKKTWCDLNMSLVHQSAGQRTKKGCSFAPAQSIAAQRKEDLVTLLNAASKWLWM